MSESSSYGESSYSSGESSSTRNKTSSESTVSSSVKKQENHVNLSGIKQKLKLIEIAVTNNLNTEEKLIFTKIFRQVIVDNEKEVISFPTASFFITKFEDLNTDILREDIKTKILNSLHEKQTEEKQNSSKLKYW